MDLRFFYLLSLLLRATVCSHIYPQTIQPDSYELVTESVTVRDLNHLFDNNRETQALLYGEVYQSALMLITLAKDFQVQSIEIISDVPSQLKQSMKVGFAKYLSDLSTSWPYDCVPNKTSTICKPVCANQWDSREGVVGQNILWTLTRTHLRGWTRVYDVLINGQPLEELAHTHGRVGDLIFLKPYSDHILGESNATALTCAEPIWKLTDSSLSNSSMAPVTSVHQNITFHFGRTCLVERFALVLSNSGPKVENIAVQFNGAKSFTRLVNPVQDCLLQFGDGDLHTCDTNDLAGYPFTSITLDIQGIVRLQVYGMPLYYPKIGIIPSSKTADAETTQRMLLKCIAMSCDSKVVTQLEAVFRGKSDENCPKYGLPVKCANMELLRVHIPTDTNGKPPLPDTLLVSDGRILSDVASIMTELQIQNATSSQLTVSFPRTHHYYSQYKCRCQADDQVSSSIDSMETVLNASEFDQDLVFQQNYTAVFDERLIETHLGFVEVPDNPQVGFFKLVIVGYSLTEKLNLNVTYLDSGQYSSISGDYAQKSTVLAFPRARNASHAWPIAAYKVELQEAWPDAADGEPIFIEWSTAEGSVSVNEVKDVLRTIVLSPARDGSVRAWLWKRDAQILDIRAYYQVGSKRTEPLQLYLQRSGCAADTQPERVSTVRFDEHHCSSGEGPVTPLCIKSDSGFVVQFTVVQPSASDTYTLYMNAPDDSADKQLIHLAAIMRNLETELDATDISMRIVTIGEGVDVDTTEMDVVLVVHSKTIVDSSACRSMYLTLHPTWPITGKLESRLTNRETEFSLSVPKDQRVLTLEMELRIVALKDSEQHLKTRRSLTLPNPLHFKPELTTFETTGYIEWFGLPSPFRGLLDRFEVKLFQTSRVCGMREEIRAPPIHEEFNGSPMYKLRLSDLSDFDSQVEVEYQIEVTPILKTRSASGPMRGSVATAVLNKGRIDHTVIKTHVPMTSRSARFYVLPSQLADCLRSNRAMMVTFRLQVIGEDLSKPPYIDVVKFEMDPVEGSTEFGRWYTAKHLLPGRRYEIEATVRYPTGEQDTPSVFTQFWTADEISVTSNQSFRSPGDRAVFNCTAAVGPDNHYRKRLDWRREDGTPLPDGGRVEIVVPPSDPKWMETLSLIFDRVEPGQSSTYACFIRPSVMEVLGLPFSPPTVKLSVSELELDKYSHQTDPGDSVTVKCTSEQASELMWVAPRGEPILAVQQSSQPYVSISDSSREDRSLTLHIPHAMLSLTGEYVCKHKGSPESRTFQLRLKEDIQLSHGTGSSNIAGEKFVLNCTASLGQLGQQIRWYKRSSTAGPWVPVSSLTNQYPSIDITTESTEDNQQISQIHWINSPSSTGEFACTVENSSDDDDRNSNVMVYTKMELPHPHVTLSTIPEPLVRIERIHSESGHEVVMKCIGYPAHESDRLTWFYLPDGRDTSGAIPLEQKVHDFSLDGSASSERATFRLGEFVPATWPGASGPILLAASRKIVRRNSELSLTTPETLELTVSGDPEKPLRTGYLICQYRRPKAVLLLLEDGFSVAPVESDSLDDHKMVVEKRIHMNAVYDVKSASVASASGHSSASPMNRYAISLTARQWAWTALWGTVYLLL